MANNRAGAATDSAPTSPGGASEDRRDSLQLAFLVFALSAGHTAASMALLIIPAVAPVVAGDYGIDPSLTGYQISIVSAGLITSAMFLGNLSRKLGAGRTNQIGHGLVAAGMLLMLLPSPIFLIAGSYALGNGYGLLGPSSSSLLMRFVPAARRNFLFSVHQTSIPIGGILAALVSPVIAVTLGWRWSLVFAASLLLMVIAIMQRGRAQWDDDRDHGAAAVSRNPLADFFMIWRDRRLRMISIVGGALCWGQFVVVSYTVVACVQELGMSLILAGTVLTIVQLSNGGGRVIAGWLADRVRSSARVITWIVWMMLATSIAAIWMNASWPTLALYLLFALLGMATGAWAGLLLADVSRLAPHGRVSGAICGALIYINIGKFLGPIAFANVYALTKSYGIAFASIALPAIVALVCLTSVTRMTRQVRAARNA